jgi:predicted dehydrogenase
MKQPNTLTRREFLKASAGVAVGGALASLPIELFAHAQGTDRLRVGLIGCGGRGTGAAIDALDAHPSVELYAMGDAFKDRLEGSLNALREELQDERKARLNVGERKFVGLDAYKQVIHSGVDIVLLCTPPAFRPIHFREAIQAGKHVFMEKPVAVCPAGARVMFQMGELATQKGLSVVAGTQRRHEPNYIETIQRIRDGAIGEIVGGACYWNQGGLWHVEKRPEWSDVEWQMRNWLYFTWLSGDFIVEQHIHNIDVINWVLGAHPVRAMGMGGRQSRVEPHYGHIYDHFAVEFEYPDGVKVLSMCRQVDKLRDSDWRARLRDKGHGRPVGEHHCRRRDLALRRCQAQRLQAGAYRAGAKRFATGSPSTRRAPSRNRRWRRLWGACPPTRARWSLGTL